MVKQRDWKLYVPTKTFPSIGTHNPFYWINQFAFRQYFLHTLPPLLFHTLKSEEATVKIKAPLRTFPGSCHDLNYDGSLSEKVLVRGLEDAS